MGIDVAKLSDLIVQDYLGNYKIVSALAQKYGFKYFFFLPPSIAVGNKPLTRRRARNETQDGKPTWRLYKLHDSCLSNYRKGIFEVSEPLLDGSYL